MVIYSEDEEVKPKKGPKKVYIIINDEKHYIDPDIVKKYNLEDVKESFFTHRKPYVKINKPSHYTELAIFRPKIGLRTIHLDSLKSLKAIPLSPPFIKRDLGGFQ